ncbi:GEVED domain-containing protein [Pontimicrobium sp. IMCC45349]|uniref:GEVED domain-containing protein n=1 Tax=Pontimicrobium sp. IMCC45349 TaxID=3391574 RepID=UPI0039A1DBD3
MIRRLLFVLFTFFSCSISFTQTNDCNNNASGELTVGNTCNFTTMDSNNNTNYWDGATGCSASDNDDVWAWFTATSTTTTITYSPPNNRDAILTLFSGACDPNMTSLDCSNIGGNGVDETIVYSTNIGVIYRIRVQRNGSNNDMNGGEICIFSPSYCIPVGTSTLDYIDDFSTTGGITNITNNNSGFSTNGYGDFTALSVEQVAGGTINFSGSFENYTYGCGIWVDWNNDFDFDDPGEQMYNSAAYIDNANDSFIVPLTALAGDYRMRILIDYYEASPDPCTIDPFGPDGEAEDYTLTVTVVNCTDDPSNITVNSITETTATLNWTAASPEPTSGYSYYVSTNNNTPNFNETPTGTTAFGITTANLTGLTQDTTYYVWVRSNCGATDGEGYWIGPVSFTTDPEPPVTTDITICQGGTGELEATGPCNASINIGNTINGNLDAATDPIAIQPQIFIVDADGCDFDDTGDTANYTTLDFQVSVTGTYSFESVAPNFDAMGYIVTGAFTPGSCATGTWITGDDDSGPGLNAILTANLTAGVTYTFITTAFGFADITVTEAYTWNMTGPGTLTTSGAGDIEWYTAPTGGTSIATGSPFNPVGVTGSGLTDTNTTGTWTYYTACSGNPSVRTPADFTINQAPTGTISGSGSTCDASTTITITLTGNQPWDVTYTDGSNTTTVNGITSSPYTFNVSPSNPTTYTITSIDDIDCSAPAGNITGSAIITGDKTWTGAIDTDWSNDNNWTPIGAPTVANCVVIPDTGGNNPKISLSDPLPPLPPQPYHALAKNLTIEANASLEIESENSITVTDWININTGGNFEIADDASLVQINNVANSGIVDVGRTTQPIYALDYTYWSSPVTLGSNYKLNTLSPNTANDGFYAWTSTVSNGAGSWQWVDPLSTDMIPAKGYIVRAPSNYSQNPATTTPFSGTFIGTPTNGDVSIPIAVGTDANIGTSVGGSIITADDDQWNLIGNPYPSAIDITLFLNHATNVPLVDGTIYVWTHNTPPNNSEPDPFYGDYGYNYTASDYASINYLGATNTAATGGQTPTQYIASGQSFFILGLANGSALFNNSMRVTGENSNFFRLNNENNTHRFWLNLSNNNGGFSQILVGYSPQATLNWDRGYDGLAFGGNAVNLYSIIPEKILCIQGRPTPFDINDEVPLGFNATEQGTYTIGIDHFDGLFDNQTIYLEDTYTNFTHDLNSAPYSFTTNAGTFDNRFIIRYTNDTLGISENELDDNLSIIATNNFIKINSKNNSISDINIYDVAGRRIVQVNNLNTFEFKTENLRPTYGTLIVSVTLDNDLTYSKKVVY